MSSVVTNMAAGLLILASIWFPATAGGQERRVETCTGRPPSVVAYVASVQRQRLQRIDPIAAAYTDYSRKIDAERLEKTFKSRGLKCWARSGDPVASYVLSARMSGVRFVTEFGPQTRLTAAAMRNYEEAAQAGGCPLGLTEAEKKFASCVDGLPEAQYVLGLAYENGLGGYSRDHAKALLWYQKSASGGLSAAYGKIIDIQNFQKN